MNIPGVTTKTPYKPKDYKPVVHNWAPTERMIPGGVMKLHACTACVPAHMKAYDLELSSTESFQGAQEYEARSIRT